MRKEGFFLKRVLCIVSSMNSGGAETFLMKIYRKINKDEIQFDFCVCSKTKGYYDEEISNLGGKIHFITPKSKNILLFRKELKKLIVFEHYNYVLRVVSNAFGFYDLKIAKQAGAKVCIGRSSNSSDGGGLINKVTHSVGKLLFLKYIDVKIAPSELAGKYSFGIRNYINNEVYILNNGLDIKEFEYNENIRHKVRKRYNISNDCLVIGHIGRFSLQKNHSFLIDIFDEVHKKNKNSKLILVGDGELHRNVVEQIKSYEIEKNVVFIKVSDHIRDLLCIMDVFVFPSLYEGMPNVVLEAQATGLPCVISSSITKSVNITGLVKFLSLKSTPDYWSKEVLNSKIDKRSSPVDTFLKEKYDIDSVVQQFESLVFVENCRGTT